MQKANSEFEARGGKSAARNCGRIGRRLPIPLLEPSRIQQQVPIFLPMRQLRAGLMKNLFVISAPSGAGKTTLASMLIKHDARVVRPVTHTTRRPGPDEINGIHYHFVSADTFKAMVERDEFIEFASVHGDLYGSTKSCVESIGTDRIAILILDCEGAANARRIFPDCTTIFLAVPSVDVLRARLAQRSREGAEAIDKRLKNAVAEMARAGEFDHVVENISLENAFLQLCRICGLSPDVAE